MEKKKIIKIILIVLVICLVLFVIDLGRKIYIISTYGREIDEYSNVTNFYKKMSPEQNVTSEFWRKDELAIFKRTTQDGVRMVYFDKDCNWIIVDTKDENNNITKIATKVSDNNGAMMPTLAIASCNVDNFWQALTIALSSKITTEELNDIECYKIFIEDDWQIFVSKDNFLTIREINGSTDTGFIEYKLNQVTDEEIKLPNLDGFEIKENI